MNGVQTARPPTPTRTWHAGITLPPRPGAGQAFDAAIEALIQDFRAEEIWVFGSCACGDATRDSDVDFLLVRQNRSDCPRPATSARLCLARLPYFLPHDIIVLTPAQWEERQRESFAVYRDILTHGVRIYAR